MAKPGRLKKAKSKKKSGSVHGPESAAQSTDHKHPVFCLKHLQKGWDLGDCSQAEKAAFAEALRKRSQLSWLELRAAPKHGLGSEPIRQGPSEERAFHRS